MPQFRIERNDNGSLRYVEDAPIANCRCSNCRADDDIAGINEVSVGIGESPAAARLHALAGELTHSYGPPRDDGIQWTGMTSSTIGNIGSMPSMYMDEFITPPEESPQRSSYRQMVARDREAARRTQEEEAARATDTTLSTAPTPSSSDAFSMNLHALAEKMMTEADSHPRAKAVKSARISSLRKTLADAYLLGVGKGYAKAAPAQEYSKMWRRLRDWGERELRHLREDETANADKITQHKAMMLRMEMMENEG